MQIPRVIRTLGLVAGLFAAAGGTALAQDANSFPSKPITFIVPFPAGGTSDILARTVAQKLVEAWGQPVVIENKPGASGNIGAAAASRAAPDGHTIMIGAAAVAVSPYLYKDPGYKLFETLEPVTVFGTVPFMLVVNPSLPVHTVAEFVDYAKKHPNALSLGSGGNGTIPHLGGELLKMRTGISFTHIPYKGGAQAMNDLVAGQIQFTIDGGAHVVTQIAAKKIRMLAVTSAQRLPQYPDTPTVAESGYPGFDASAWQILLVTAGTPKPIIAKIQAEVARALKSPDMVERLAKMGIIASGNTPEEAGVFLRAEMAKWSEVVRASGAKVD